MRSRPRGSRSRSTRAYSAIGVSRNAPIRPYQGAMRFRLLRPDDPQPLLPAVILSRSQALN